MKTPNKAVAELEITTMTKQAPAATSLATAFKAAGFKLALVGGPVRDAILGRLGNDLDFTTNARPKESEKILKKWADSVWDIGAAFGTVAGKKGEITVEITTYRSENYEKDSRKPAVEFGENIEGDLSRRDFTINAMALELTTDEPTFIDLFNIFSDSFGCALVVKSKSLPSRPNIASRTGPPTSANLNPAALKAVASEVAAGACFVSVVIASSAAALFGVFTVVLG